MQVPVRGELAGILLYGVFNLSRYNKLTDTNSTTRQKAECLLACSAGGFRGIRRSSVKPPFFPYL